MEKRNPHVFALEEYTSDYLELSWDWLNDPEIKQLMLAPDFTKEQQWAFFDSLRDRRDYWIRGFSCDSMPVGAAGLKNISPEKQEAEYWGYIGDKRYWGQGGGKQMLRMVLEEARRRGLKRIYLHVWKENHVAISFYIKSGFEYEGEYGVKLRYAMVLE
ncbi:MAG: GNAT family N-acetyltransferase [Chlorobiaceae bacterium]|nr:GNAT family N-acetyltransferase [Chlorobiaceae bacterium]